MTSGWLVSGCSIHLQHQFNLTLEPVEQRVRLGEATNTFAVGWTLEERILGDVEPVSHRVIDCQIGCPEQATSVTSKKPEGLITDRSWGVLPNR